MRDRLQKLEVFQGDMLKDTGIMVIPVNCVPGVMGKGLAKQFADEFPWAREKHKRICESTGFCPGRPAITYTPFGNPVVYFATKRHWSRPSEIEWIREGLDYLRITIAHMLPPTIDFSAIITPALGCGEGGLKYADVYPLIANFANSLPEPYHVRLYRPHN